MSRCAPWSRGSRPGGRAHPASGRAARMVFAGCAGMDEDQARKTHYPGRILLSSTLHYKVLSEKKRRGLSFVPPFLLSGLLRCNCFALDLALRHLERELLVTGFRVNFYAVAMQPLAV